MSGKTRRVDVYYVCAPPQLHHRGRSGWYRDYPKSLWVRQDALLDAVHRFFAERIFGPQRHTHLRARLADRQNTPKDEVTTRRARLTAAVGSSCSAASTT